MHKIAEALTRTAVPQLFVHNLSAKLLHETVQVLRTTFGAAAVAVVLNDKGDDYGVASVDGDGTVRRSLLRRGEGLTGQAIERAEPVFTEDNVRGRDPLMPAAASLIAMPIVGQRRTYGAITVGGAPGQSWNEEDRQTLKALTNMLAVVIEQRVQHHHDEAIASTERVQKLERALISLRKPISELQTMHQHLLAEGQLSYEQLETVRQMNSIVRGIGYMLGARSEQSQKRTTTDTK